jgi:hypothetical protein
MKSASSNTKGKAAGCYLYAIVRAPVAADVCGIPGILEAPLYAIEYEGIAVIASDVPAVKLRPERRNIAAHHQVQRHLMAHGTLLPMAFGTVADSRKAAERMLKVHRTIFLDNLDKLAGKVEMGLRVSLETPQVVEYFVAHSSDLQTLRDQMRLLGGGSRDDRIEIGRQFEQVLQRTREDAIERIEAVLAPVCADIQRNPEKSERELANLACLVPRDELADFEARIGEAADQFDDEHVFQFSGPWPPHNFVHLDVKL